ncbi:MAG: type IV pilus assembly protein PilM [Patescibacteria group bacterium]
MSLFSADVVPKSFVGIDVGSSALKVVEISGWADRRVLKNYGELKVRTLYEKPFRTFEKNALLLSTQDIAKALRALLQETNILQKKAIFSISDFSTFFTNFELPTFIEKKELKDAVGFEARKHVPLPLSEVTIDWQVLANGNREKNKPYRILLIAVPNEVINQYQEIARLSRLELMALEAEVFGCIRSSLKEEKGTVLLLDIGAQTTTVSIVKNGNLWNSHTVDIGGNHFAQRIAKALSLDYTTAEQEKRTKGLEVMSANILILVPLVDMIVLEMQKSMENFFQKEKGEIAKIVLAGGAARLPGLQEYFEKTLQKKTELLHPFRNILYSPILEETLNEIGPSFAVAVGMALRGFE